MIKRQQDKRSWIPDNDNHPIKAIHQNINKDKPATAGARNDFLPNESCRGASIGSTGEYVDTENLEDLQVVFDYFSNCI